MLPTRRPPGTAIVAAGFAVLASETTHRRHPRRRAGSLERHEEHDEQPWQAERGRGHGPRLDARHQACCCKVDA
ncbi:MAG: hypothetical protein ABI534_03230 [Chloroflexota bacterium]